MQFKITKIDVAGGLVHGLMRAGGRDLRTIAERYMETPNKSCPYAGGSGNLCPVESWIAKTRGEVPGGDAGDWGLVFSIRDHKLLAGIRDGTHSIEVTKSSTDAIDFDINKSMKVKKDMSTANETFNDLVEERMAEIRAAGSDLSTDELREKAVAEILEVHPEFAPEAVEKGAREFHMLVNERVNIIRKSASAPRDTRVIKAMASTEISRERPDLARSVVLKERIEATMPPTPKIAKAAPQQPMGPAAREMDKLVKSRMAEIRKSAGSAAASSEKILDALATVQICKEHPGLMREVLNEERRVDARLAYGGF
ncbi:hypothetical protein [Methanothrix sp.]|uniref:hypothetical protein n=1 Tax=Methanothrix sp. TaxID=90426 RepID=UPI003BB7246C